MIEKFSVTNYLSIKDEQTISFKANNRERKYKEITTTLLKDGKTRLSKILILYGPNASGKTNILNALNFLRDLVVEQGKKEKDDTTEYIPFLFDEATSHSPGIFNLLFYIDDDKYEYNITLDSKIIYSENLLIIKGSGEESIYSRKFDEKAGKTIINFSNIIDLDEDGRLFIRANTLPNMTVLATYNITNVTSKILQSVYAFFDNILLPIITPNTNLIDWTSDRLFKTEGCKDFLVDFLKEADFNVEGINIEEKELIITDKIINSLKESGAPQEVIDGVKDKKSVKVKKFNLVHNTLYGSERLEFELESRGTTRYFGIGGVLEKLIRNKNILLVDELESSLHPDLVAHLIKTFLMNTNNSQLFVTTHNISLLEADFLRRDMVWFCEKKSNGDSVYYSASEFKLHHNVSLAKFYKMGKIGAIPNLGSIILNKEECD